MPISVLLELKYGRKQENEIPYCFIVKQEGEPGHHHDHEAGDVDGDNVERQLPCKYQVHSETAVFTW